MASKIHRYIQFQMDHNIFESLFPCYLLVVVFCINVSKHLSSYWLKNAWQESIHDISNLLFDIISFGKVCVYAGSWDENKRKDGLTGPTHRISPKNLFILFLYVTVNLNKCYEFSIPSFCDVYKFVAWSMEFVARQVDLFCSGTSTNGVGLQLNVLRSAGAILVPFFK